MALIHIFLLVRVKEIMIYWHHLLRVEYFLLGRQLIQIIQRLRMVRGCLVFVRRKEWRNVMDKKVIFIPGNSGGTPRDNWFPVVRKELEVAGFTVIAEDFPDNDLARSSFWLPYLLDELKADENSI